jgi:hypothetical protein
MPDNNRRSQPVDLEHQREITNTGGQPSRGEREQRADKREYERRESGPERAGLKEGDDSWHNRSNRSGDRSEGAEPGRGGNLRR